MKPTLQSAPPKQQRLLSEAFSAELVGRLCELAKPPKRRVMPVPFHGDCIAFVSPESTYAVTKPLLEGAQKSILIGIYDFTAGSMKQLLLRALSRGVKVSLMLDLDDRSGETALFDDLAKHGCECVPAPSCASRRAHYFPCAHEKVIVIDGRWVLVQSGNWSDASIPQNEKDGGDPAHFVYGNRDAGVALDSPALAKFFTAVIRGDMKLELGAEALAQKETVRATLEAFGAKPSAPPPKRFASKRFTIKTSVPVTPILSPDNYMSVVPEWLAAARRTIEIEQQYIRPRQPGIRRLLGAIVAARKAAPKLTVRIVLGHPASPAAADDIRALEEFGLRLGEHVRLISRKHFVHCHNKLVIVDGREVLVSSQNWSDSAVTKNREAGLLIPHRPIAQYFHRVFALDWETGERTIPRVAAPQLFTPESLATGRTLPLNWGDYAEV